LTEKVDDTTDKSVSSGCPSSPIARLGKRVDRPRGVQSTGCHQGRYRRKAFSTGLRSLACKRRIGVDAGQKRWGKYRVLVYLLARKTRTRMAALGCGCS